MAFQHNVCWEEIDGAGGQLKGDHRARWDLSFPEWSFPGLHWFLNSHVYLPASTTLLEPHKVSLTLSPAMETHLGRENPCMDVIQEAFSFLFNTISNYGLQLCVQNIWSLRTVRKSKSLWILDLKRAGSSFRSWDLGSGVFPPRLSRRGRRHLEMLSGPLDICQQVWNLWFMEPEILATRNKFLLTQNKNLRLLLYKLFIVWGWGRGGRQWFGFDLRSA